MARKNFKEVTKKEEEFEQRVIDLARVTRVMAGGKRMKFRACLAIGDRKGRVGFGVAKGADVTMAVTKALNKAKKNLIKVTLVNETIPHQVKVKFKSAKIILKPAQKGNGVKAGGPVRVLCELAGISNITAKILGSGNKINNVKAVMIALQSFKPSKKTDKLREEAVLEKRDREIVETPKSEKVKDTKKTFKEKLKNLITKTKEDK
jgi:small subunit ribosomal protein S5